MGVEQGPGEEEANFKAPETGFEPRPGEEDLTQEEATSRAEAMARAGDKAERGAARERQLASGQAKETLGERVSRRAVQTTRGASVDLAFHGGYGLHEGADKEYHAYKGSLKEGEADRKEEKAGKKWEKKHGKDQGRKAA